jgi:hypothetical protein
LPRFIYLGHSPTGFSPKRNYNNTVFIGPDIEQECPLGFGHNVTGIGAYPNQSAVAHEVFNNIFIRQVWDGKRYDPNAGDGHPGTLEDPSDFIFGRDMQWNPNDSNEFWDYNMYYRDLDGTAAVDPWCRGTVSGGQVRTDTYTNMAAWRASANFNASKASGEDRGAYTPGFEGNGTDVKPTMPSLDDFPASRFNYRPTATAAVTVATTTSLSGVNWWSTPPSWGATYFPWNDGAMTLAPSAWKGALDPSGMTMPVGVQNP